MPSIDREFLLLLKDDFTNYDAFIETGTYMGDTTFCMEPLFKKVYTVEVKPEIYNNTKSKYRGDKIVFLLGDSSKVFMNILPTIDTNSIFFLDGHYSSGNTGKGEKDCPLIEELKAINILFKKAGIIIIDDCRLFGQGPSNSSFAEDWTSISELSLLDVIRNRITNMYYLDSAIAKNDRMILHIRDLPIV
jgi:hypothetical protein